MELSSRLSKEELYKDARLYFLSFPQFFHINDRVEFDHVAGTDLKDSGREEMKDEDFICPSLESESESSESSESSSSKSEESKDGPAEAYNDLPQKKAD